MMAVPLLPLTSPEPLMGESKDVATIWRGPLKTGVIRQFISDIEWSDLDFMIIDSPPGTGDEPLTVAQTIPGAKALIVTIVEFDSQSEGCAAVRSIWENLCNLGNLRTKMR